MVRMCRALFIGAVASGQGKTSVTAGLARYYARRGLRVRVFKTGPDFLDPKILEAASAAPVLNIDCWMVGLEESKALLAQAAAEADLILIEGAMGLHDGDPSGADLARALGVPVGVVIDASAMAQTFGAVAHGLRTYRDIPFAGVIANRVAGEGHLRMLRDSLGSDIALIGAIPAVGASLPERHLGLVPAEEQPELSAALERLAEAIGVWGAPDLPAPVAFAEVTRPTLPPHLDGRVIAVARDAAFSFLYHANLACLEAMGAEVAFFSPLADEPVPGADALYMPGGYPELHADALCSNGRWQASVRAHAAAGRPVVAECGGLMALADTIVTHDGAAHPMARLLPGRVRMRERVAALGLQSLALPEGELRGHTFHYSEFETPLEPFARCVPHGFGAGEHCYRAGSVVASYLHGYFPSAPSAVAALFGGTA